MALVCPFNSQEPRSPICLPFSIPFSVRILTFFLSDSVSSVHHPIRSGYHTTYVCPFQSGAQDRSFSHQPFSITLFFHPKSGPFPATGLHKGSSFRMFSQFLHFLFIFAQREFIQVQSAENRPSPAAYARFTAAFLLHGISFLADDLQ